MRTLALADSATEWLVAAGAATIGAADWASKRRPAVKLMPNG